MWRKKLLIVIKLHLYNETNNFFNAVKNSYFYYIIRDEDSTVEKTLALLEKHFNLI